MSEVKSCDLTLIIPTYNRGVFIRETIERALRQTVPFAEIIVVNDGSTDKTQDVLFEFGEKIKLINQDNSGVQAARNAGVNAASSAYVTFCDDDDLLGLNYVETMKKWLETHKNVDVIYCNFEAFNESGVMYNKFECAPQGYFKDAEIEGDFIVFMPHMLRQTIRFQPLFPSGMTVNKSFYCRIGGFNPKYRRNASEDWDFTLRAIDRGVVHICKKALNSVRKHASNQSGDPLKQGIGEAVILMDALVNIPSMQQYRLEVLRSITLRRLSSFNVAFARGDFRMCKEISSLIDPSCGEFRYLLKRYISRLPLRLGRFLWRIIQSRNNDFV
jgi:glycosyltransferase involved in cell wall biosynthesis